METEEFEIKEEHIKTKLREKALKIFKQTKPIPPEIPKPNTDSQTQQQPPRGGESDK